MADRIMAGRSTPQSPRRKSGATPSSTPTGEDARDLLEIKLAQLNSLL